MPKQVTITLDDDAAQRLESLAGSLHEQSALLSGLLRNGTDSAPAATQMSLETLARKVLQLEADVAELKEMFEELEDAGWARIYREDKDKKDGEDEVIPLRQVMAEAGYKPA